MSAATTPITIDDRYTAALARAKAAGLVAYKVTDVTYEVPSHSDPSTLHTVTFVGPEWHRWTCSCAGGNHPCCMHRATALAARRWGVSAIRGGSNHTEEAAAVAAAEAIIATPTECPGALKLHAPAPGSNIETYVCAHCERG